MKVVHALLLLPVLSTAFSNNMVETFQSKTRDPIKVGFVGCGLIASCIAKGLLKQSDVPIDTVTVSKRSESRSFALREQFSKVTVCEENQAVVDASDVVFICVLPQQVSEVTASLQFDHDRHILVSLVSTSDIDQLCRDSGLDKSRVFKMICLPSVAENSGLCLVLTPETRNPDIIYPMCKSLGGCVQAENSDQMSALMVTTCMMGPFYGILKNNREFLMKQGIPASEASFLVGKLYSNMMKDAEKVQDDPKGFDHLIEEQTPGGLNEQAYLNLQEAGALDAYDRIQTAVLSRIRGESDGTLPK